MYVTTNHQLYFVANLNLKVLHDSTSVSNRIDGYFKFDSEHIEMTGGKMRFLLNDREFLIKLLTFYLLLCSLKSDTKLFLHSYCLNYLVHTAMLHIRFFQTKRNKFFECKTFLCC